MVVKGMEHNMGRATTIKKDTDYMHLGGFFVCGQRSSASGGSMCNVQCNCHQKWNRKLADPTL
eukprot:11900114-Karenia_brevis.AAC.1